MKVTVQFNIRMTFAFIGLEVLTYPIHPIHPHDLTPSHVKTWFPESVVLQDVIGLTSAVLGIVASMYIVRALWNRLFPSLCQWNEITLAESYAVSLLAAMLIY